LGGGASQHDTANAGSKDVCTSTAKPITVTSETTTCRHETGDVFAIDLGGTNFRVMHIVLSDEQSVVVRHLLPSAA
jgi:hexokinase